MAYVKHKPQYRNVRTPNAADFGRPRDIRRRLPDARGKVILPDSSGLPRRFGGTPKRAPAFGRANFTFSPPVMKVKPPSVWWRGGAAQLAPAMRGVAWFMAAYDIYHSVERMLGGSPYMVNSEKPWAGGPDDNYAVFDHPSYPGQYFFVPSPDGSKGWTMKADPVWKEVVLTGKYYSVPGFIRNWGRRFPTPWNDLHKSMPNGGGTYSPAQVIAAGAPPTISLTPRQFRYESRVQRGVRDNQPLSYIDQVGAPKLVMSKAAPSGTPDPVNSWPGPVVLPSVPTPGEIAAHWPVVGAIAPAILPFGQPWVPLPWSAVNAVNAVRGAIGIREENFLDDLGMPRPVPKPEVNHRPPRPGEKEKKGRSNNGRLLLFYQAVKKAWHEIDEHIEKVDIIYDALPGWVRNRERAKLPHEKVAAIIRNIQHVDVGEAIYGLIENEVEDAAFGRGFKSLSDAFERMGVRGWRGDLAMSYSTDALFELYGALKGGL